MPISELHSTRQPNSAWHSIWHLKKCLSQFDPYLVNRFALEKLVIVGDGKTFRLIWEITNEYPEEYSWILRYLGEFYQNSVYIRCIYKLYAGCGLKTLASSSFSGITLKKSWKSHITEKPQDLLWMFWILKHFWGKMLTVKCN